jgi:hypothetical protein
MQPSNGVLQTRISSGRRTARAKRMSILPVRWMELDYLRTVTCTLPALLLPLLSATSTVMV